MDAKKAFSLVGILAIFSGLLWVVVVAGRTYEVDHARACSSATASADRAYTAIQACLRSNPYCTLRAKDFREWYGRLQTRKEVCLGVGAAE